MDLTSKFNGRLGGIGNGPNFVDHRLCERVQAVIGDEVPEDLVQLGKEVDALYTNWCQVVQRYNELARALRNRADEVLREVERRAAIEEEGQ